MTYLLNDFVITLYEQILTRAFVDDPEIALTSMQARHGSDVLFDHNSGQSIATLSAKERFLIRSEISKNVMKCTTAGYWLQCMAPHRV